MSPLGVLAFFAFVPAAQESSVKSGQLGKELSADNLLRDLKEIFTPPWELSSPAEGNAAQPHQTCLSAHFSSFAESKARVVPGVAPIAPLIN